MSVLKRNATALIVGKFFSFVCQMAVPIALVRLLEQESYGFYQKLITLSTFFMPVIGLSLKSSMFYFHPITSVENRKRLLAQSLVLPCMAAMAILILGVLALNIQSQPSLSVYWFFIVVTYTVVLLTSRFTEVVFILENKTRGLVLFHVFDSSFRALFLIGAAYFFGTTESLFYGLLILLFLESLVLVYFLKKKYEINFCDLTKDSLSRQFSYTKPLIISEIVGKMGMNADKYILALMLTAHEFAIYSVGTFRLSFIILLFTSVGNVILPKLSELGNEGHTRGAFKLWRKMVFLNGLVTIPTVVFFIGNAKQFMGLLFSDEYLASVPIFQIVVLTLLIQMLGHGYVLRAFGENRYVLRANVWRTIVSIGFGWFLIQHLGMIGGAITFVLSVGVNASIQLYRTKEVLGIKSMDFLPWRNFAQVSLASISLSSIFYGLSVLQLPNFWHLVLGSAFYFGAIGAWYFHRGWIDKSFLGKLNLQSWKV